MDTSKDTSWLSPSANRDPNAYAQRYAQIIQWIQTDDPNLIQLLEAHGQGDSDADSPFISVARNFVSLSYSTDDSPGGVESILQNAPHLVHFDVPDLGQDGVWLIPAPSLLSQSETELLVLLPPGVTLKQYVMEIDDEEMVGRNPYQGMDMNARDEYNQRLQLVRTRFLIGDQGLREVPYYDQDDEKESSTQQSATVSKGDLTPKEIAFVMGRVADTLSKTVEELSTWKQSELAQYLDPEIEAYLKFINANPEKRAQYM